MSRRKAPPKGSSSVKPDEAVPASSPGPDEERRQAVQVLHQYLNMYVYELRRNAASPDFITRAQSETTWALNALAKPIDGSL